MTPRLSPRYDSSSITATRAWFDCSLQFGYKANRRQATGRVSDLVRVVAKERSDIVNFADHRKPHGPSMRPRNMPGEKHSFSSCKQAVDLIGRYLSSELAARELAAFETHMAICPDCVAFLKTYKATIDATKDFLALQNKASHKLSLMPPRKRLKRR